ncbi:hypothetical protein RYH80_18380 [Halobaculum sp. MBLA0147]|uniref:hypothetical protein n=1 Tax=Halobaculum sp. MBLA0147 TaxID=3079934 RepID=UPI00352656E2
MEEVNGIHELRARIRDAEAAVNPLTEWTEILNDHLNFGNNGKLSDQIGVFNFNSATDCLNLGTDRCQVSEGDCYAKNNERFPNALSYRRRQEIVWDHLDPATFADAFDRVARRKRTDVSILRLSQSGDFRNRHDVLKAEAIANILAPQYDVYTYTASSWLPFDETDTLTVNASNPNIDSADRRFVVVDDVESIPEDGIRCPEDLSDGEVECGQCRLCIDKDAGNVYIQNLYADD